MHTKFKINKIKNNKKNLVSKTFKIINAICNC